MSTSLLKYAIIDVETTGGSAHRERLTEIAIAIHDGEKVLDTFESLLNPERSIPPFIQNLTGITDEMVEEAPYFYEIARKVVEMTEGCVFVAHNVKFDYMFIRSEFDRLGYSYQRRQLCTKQLSKKLFPEIGRYGLDQLIRFFNIHTDVRHRAMADVQATIVVFEKLLQADREKRIFSSQINQGVKLSKLPGTIAMDDIHRIPESSGIYYFFGENDHLLYVGKSKNIQKRVLQHFSKPTSRSIKFLEQTRRIDFEVTGSEIAAILREDAVIKEARPEYNVAQRKTQKMYGLCFVEHENNSSYHLELHPILDDQEDGFIKTYKSKRTAKTHLESLLETFLLKDYLTIEKSGSGMIVRNGNISQEEQGKWTERMNQLRELLESRYRFHHLVIDNTYSHQEATCFVFNRGKLLKKGTIASDSGISSVNIADLDDCRIPLAINDQIVAFIQKHRKRYVIKKLP